MKKLLLLIVAMSSSSIAAESGALPSFPEVKVTLPPLALSEAGVQVTPVPMDLLKDSRTWFRAKGVSPTMALSPAPAPRTGFRGKADAPKGTQRLVSAMPIVSPGEGFGTRMPIKAPDASVDYKLNVKEPAMVPAK